MIATSAISEAISSRLASSRSSICSSCCHTKCYISSPASAEMATAKFFALWNFRHSRASTNACIWEVRSAIESLMARRLRPIFAPAMEQLLLFQRRLQLSDEQCVFVASVFFKRTIQVIQQAQEDGAEIGGLTKSLPLVAI
jgi:hypothetical protein